MKGMMKSTLYKIIQPCPLVDCDTSPCLWYTRVELFLGRKSDFEWIWDHTLFYYCLPYNFAELPPSLFEFLGTFWRLYCVYWGTSGHVSLLIAQFSLNAMHLECLTSLILENLNTHQLQRCHYLVKVLKDSTATGIFTPLKSLFAPNRFVIKCT